VSVAAKSQPTNDPPAEPPVAAIDGPIGRLLKGRYRVVRLLGRGAMGNVYEVRHEGLNTSFALKQLRADLESESSIVARFRHEAEMMARLAHPNIVRVFDIDAEPGFGTWIAMEMVHGEDLGALLARGGALPLAEVVRVGGELASALACAHRAGLVHRDIKPANVLVESASGRAVLTDFGIAKSVAVSGQELSTQTGGFIGTYRYSSPEQIRHLRGVEIDPRADVYSLGVVLYEMVSGKRFLDGMNEGEIVSEVGFRSDWVPPLRYDTPPPAPLGLLIERCLAPRREERMASAGEVGSRLAAFGAALGVAANAAAPSRPAEAPTPMASLASSARERTAATLAPACALSPGEEAYAAGLVARRGAARGRALRSASPRIPRRSGIRFATALVVLLATAGLGAWLFPERVLAPLGLHPGAGNRAQIRSAQPEDSLIWLTRSDAQWFSVVLSGVAPDRPPRMRWFLNDKLVAENTTTWEYDPTTDLADVTAHGEVRFVVGSGRGLLQTHRWKTRTAVQDLSPVLRSATYKPGSTIRAAAGERIEIVVEAIDPDGDPLFYTWQVNGHRVGGSEPRLVLDATESGTITLGVSDGVVSVSSAWNLQVAGG